jgi:hypothetical protein
LFFADLFVREMGATIVASLGLSSDLSDLKLFEVSAIPGTIQSVRDMTMTTDRPHTLA